ncbi:hypothetical protein FXO37_01922 [Capsicum annuum]|nr:hypothetical protein FXO37_01922 [Capsicum annuum]
MSGCSSMLESHNFSKYVAPSWVDEPNRQLYCDMSSRDLTFTLRLSFDSIEFGDVALPSLALSVVQDASHRPMDITEVIPTHKNNRKSKHCVDPVAAITRRDNRDKDDFTHGEHRPRASIRHRSYDTGVMGLQFKHLSSLLAWAMLPYWFSAMTMKSVGSAALKMVEEVRRQFNGIPGLMEGTTMSVLIFIDSHVAASQDKENGGISDRPDDAVDVFQTYFGVTGLSLPEYPEIKPIDLAYAC